METVQIGDLFDSPPREYKRRVRVIGFEGDRAVVENTHTRVKTRLGPSTIRRWVRVTPELGAGGGS